MSVPCCDYHAPSYRKSIDGYWLACCDNCASDPCDGICGCVPQWSCLPVEGCGKTKESAMKDFADALNERGML